MKKEQLREAGTNIRTQEKDLLKDLKLLLADFFVCDLMEGENTLFVRLKNGQLFRISLEEVQ